MMESQVSRLTAVRERRTADRRWLAAGVLLLTLLFLAGTTGHLEGGRAFGADPAHSTDPVALLGTVLDDGTCPSGPMAVGGARVVVCPRWTAITTPDGRVQAVSLYGPGSSTVDSWDGRLPQGLHWGDQLADVWSRLGRPQRVTSAYGPPTLVYWFTSRPYGSLELRFDAGDALVRINASILR